MSYGDLRSTRKRNAGWQWLMVGAVLGFGCAVALFIALYALGAVRVGGEAAAIAPTPSANVIVDEDLPTQTPYVIVVTATLPTPSGLTIIQPTETPPQPTSAPTEFAVQAIPTTAVPAAAQSDQAGGQPAALGGTPLTTPVPTLDTGGVDALLLTIRTPLQLVSGGDFRMGTTLQEAQAAVSVCVNTHNAACEASFAEDSFPPYQASVNSFQMEVTEVTVGQYVVFLNALGPNSHLNGCAGNACAATQTEEPNSLITFDAQQYSVPDFSANYPITHVTWYGAQAYCEAIGRRLPSEAEWERAARGTDGRIYPWGNEADLTRFNSNRTAADPTVQDANPGPEPVGTYGQNGASPYGIQDMAGNVGEWVQDWYSAGYYAQMEQQAIASGAPVLNSSGPAVGTSKVVRGGHWDAVPFFARSVHRQDFAPNDQTLYIGFRCVSDDLADGQGQPGAAGDSSGNTALPTLTPAALPSATLDPNAPTVQPSPLPSLPPGG